MNIAQTYDDLADHYHLIFENWESSIERQASVLSTVLRRYCDLTSGAHILDCACGIGTQSLGLAKLGFQIAGCDISPRAVERAKIEASKRDLDIPFSVANMLDLSSIAGRFDAVLCADNAFPHLESAEQLADAGEQMRSRLRPGGWLIASIRDYDILLIDKPAVQGPSFFQDRGHRRIVFQVWEWLDSRQYVFHLYITHQLADKWQTFHTAGHYRAVTRDELSAALEQAHFRDVRWLLPAESGFYQPIVIARAN